MDYVKNPGYKNVNSSTYLDSSKKETLKPFQYVKCNTKYNCSMS